jgi:hypothetical protein
MMVMAPSETIETALDLLVISGAAFWDGSLPGNAVDAARTFLRRGLSGRLAGPQFDRCHKAASAMKDWRP